MTEIEQKKSLLNVTPTAVSQLRKLKAQHNPQAVGIRLGVRDGGCNGKSYAMDFADSIEPGDEVMDLGGVSLLIDPMSTMFLIGTEMDFVEEKLGATFVFKNPNETGRCGCGESFSV
jgi:iron-sulfur cluster assembly protein